MRQPSKPCLRVAGTCLGSNGGGYYLGGPDILVYLSSILLFIKIPKINIKHVQKAESRHCQQCCMTAGSPCASNKHGSRNSMIILICRFIVATKTETVCSLYLRPD